MAVEMPGNGIEAESHETVSICRGRAGRPGCGKDIVWGVDEKGTRIPLDPRAPVYHVLSWDPVSKLYAVERAIGEKGTYQVSHFATCPMANNFSRSTRKAMPDQGTPTAAD